MKAILADLLADISYTYDQNKTTLVGKVDVRTVNSQYVLGPPLSKFIDFATDTGGLVPTGSIHPTANGRLFICGTVSAGVIPIILYDFNYTTGVHEYIGRINMTTPNSAATTHTIRSIRALDSGTTGWKIYVATVGTVTINGGLFCLNNISKSDFVQVAYPTIPFATGNGQKAVYFLQDPATLGAAHLQIATAGLALDSDNNKVYAHNGVSATHQYYVRDTTTSLTWSSASVTISVASPGVVSHSGHSYIAGDQVIFISGTLPTGLSLNTVYFVKNPVAGTSYELSATTGGASINTTGSPGSAVIGRAFGITGDSFLHKTGNLPALTGTLLVTDSENTATPTNAPLNGSILNGNKCVFLSTSTQLYLGLLSDLTSGATTWPSLTTSNLLGAVNEVTVPANANANWSDAFDCAVYVSNTAKFIFKKVENNKIITSFGNIDNTYYESRSNVVVPLAMAALNAFDLESGWLFAICGTVGQRGIYCVNVSADCCADESYIITKVLDKPDSHLVGATLAQQLINQTGPAILFYRNTGFGSSTGNWIELPQDGTYVGIDGAAQIQFKICFGMQSYGHSIPAQVQELFIGVMENSAISDNWEYSHDDSSSGTPSRVAFRLKKAYVSSVPTLYFRTYDLNGSGLVNHNTVTNASHFEYSTNNGSSWLPLGTISNTVGTLIRYTFTSPPGEDIRPTIRES